MSDNSDAFEDRKSEMLEDEEMPTFVSVSSKDISLPYNADGNVQLLPIDNPSNPLEAEETAADVDEVQSRSQTTEEREDETNNENEEGSVYVLSSGDDGAYPESSSPSNYEEIDEEEDEEDEEEVDDEEDANDICGIDMVAEEVEVPGEAFDDFSEEEIEHEPVMSDDMVLRSVKPKPNQQKRSQSMLDLSDLSQLPRRMLHLTGGNQYNRVQSKVKRYIQDIKEMSKRSIERRKSSEEAMKLDDRKGRVNRDEEIDENRCKSTGRRSIKGYAEQALKDLEMRDEVSQESENAPTPKDENGSARRNSNLQVEKWDLSKTENHQRRLNNLDSESNVVNDTAVRLKKPNMNGELLFKDGLKNAKLQKDVSLHNALNGQAQSQSIMDVRSIDYDEYMRGGSNSSMEKNSIATNEAKAKSSHAEVQAPQQETKNHQNEARFEIEKEPAQTMEETPMEIVERQQDLKSIAEPETNVKRNSEALAEVALIQSQLNQKTTQCKEIREAYQRTLSENFELKQELENLKKTLSKLTAKKSTPQLVTVAIQTDPPPSSDELKNVPAANNGLKQILSTSSMGSAISYNDRWAESAGSLPTSNGSTRPMPNLTPLSNAEDSFIGVASTPPRTPRQPSHAFQTSSRIIKMLSSITQRGSKVEDNVNKEESLASVCGKTVNSTGVSNFNSPINHRSSNKRKAAETPENTNFLQPPKIPHTAGGSHRFHKRTKSEFKYPGDFVKPSLESFAPESSNANRTQENSEDSKREDETGDEVDSRVKCFTYHDDDNSLERSFLIQAEEEGKGQEGPRDGERISMGVVRECGPYLLGNVEVRMTEINGTINIWGKEVSRETNNEDELEEEVIIENQLNESGTCNCGLQTPKPRHSSNGPISCSTNKKSKIPPLRLTEFGCLKHHNSPLASGPRASMSSAMENIRERHHLRNSPNPETEVYCKHFDGHSNSCNVIKSKIPQNFGEEEHVKNIPKNYCNYNLVREKCQYSSCGRVCGHCRSEHDCAFNATNPHTSGRCSRLNSGKDNEQSKTEDNTNRNNCLYLNGNCAEENSFAHHCAVKNNACEDDDDDVFKKPSTSYARVNENYCQNESCRSQSPSFNNQSTGPLLSHHLHEPPEVRRRRSSGKRVRGILMDFLKGCGDCRTTSGPENKVSPSILPQIRVRSGSPPPSLSTPIQQRTTNYGSIDNRCVHTECCKTCAQRLEVATEIEAQLKIFEAEMERLRSRSQAVLGMLNTLHSADMN